MERVHVSEAFSFLTKKPSLSVECGRDGYYIKALLIKLSCNRQSPSVISHTHTHPKVALVPSGQCAHIHTSTLFINSSCAVRDSANSAVPMTRSDLHVSLYLVSPC